jgi:asparagine synthase (glutamine-hydrolysing)
VKLQMRSDVPVGLFLSSGVDSGALLSIMSKLSNHPIQTFTLGFDDGEKTNENEDARKMAKMFNSDHREMTLSYEDYVKYYERYLWDIEEPVGNETAAAFYFLSKMTSEHVKCALAGQGADEPWAGYDRYLGMKYSKYYAQLPQFLTRDVLSPLGQRFVKNEVLKRGLSSLHEKDILTRMVNVYSFFSTDMKRQLFQPWVKQHISANGVEAKRALAPLQRDVADLDPLTQILYMDTRSNLPDDLLMVGDKTSMANSLELRVPFLDYRLVEFIETLPPNLKIKGLNGKYLHKKASEKWLPKEIVYRKKKGFANPVGDWLRTSMKSFVHESLLSSDSAAAKYFDQKYIRELLADHEGQQEQRRRHIYLLLSFELWHRQFISA